MPKILSEDILDMSEEDIIRLLATEAAKQQTVEIIQELKEKLTSAVNGFENLINAIEKIAMRFQPMSRQEVDNKLRHWADGTLTVDSPEVTRYLQTEVDITKLSPDQLTEFKHLYLGYMQHTGEKYIASKNKLEIAKKHLRETEQTIALMQTFAEQKGTMYHDSPLRSRLTAATDALMALQKNDHYMHFFNHYGKNNNRALRIACTDQSMILLTRLANIHKLQPIALDPNQRAGELQKNAFHIAAEKGGQAMYNKLLEFGFADQELQNTDGKKPSDYLQAHQARVSA